MSETMTTIPVHAHRASHKPPTAARRARAALAAEWIKLRSLRAMLVTALGAVVVSIGLAASVCANYASQWPRMSAPDKAAFSPLDTNLQFVVIGAIFVARLGAQVATSEYGNGLIRTTFTATPQRVLVLSAKAVLASMVAFAVSAAVCFAAFFIGQGLLSGHAPHVALGDPGVLGHVLGAVYYLTAAGVIGLFIGALARSAAAAISGIFALMLVLPLLANKLPGGVSVHTVPYLPFNLGWSLWHSAVHASGHVSAGTAVVALAAWVLALGALSAVKLRKRDA